MVTTYPSAHPILDARLETSAVRVCLRRSYIGQIERAERTLRS